MSTPITLVTPEANTAEAWNQQIKDAAEKAGLELPQPGAAAAAAVTATPKKEDDTIYRSTLSVGGKDMVFEGKDAAEVLGKYAIAVEASQLAAAPPAAAVVEEPKPKFTEAELFDIQVGLQKGDPTVLENFIVKSGVIDRYLESKGIKVDELKKATEARQSGDLNARWEQATKDFAVKVKAGESDYPGGEQNTYLMGLMLAELGLREKPSVESFEKAYDKLKERKLVFPVKAKTAEEIAAAAAEEVKPKKEATSSTALGTHGSRNDQNAQPAAPTGKVELDTTNLSIREAADSWNKLIGMGYTPAQIVIKQ